jgi:SAM-dependent methyltransferase
VGDASALASALRRVLTDAGLRAQLAHGAQLARDRIPTWDQQVEKMAAALAEVGRVLRARQGNSFSADWLTLREPADAAARSASLTRALVDALPSTRPLRILDLGAGTGANARYLADRLPSPQQWLLVDHDERLIARAAATVCRAGCEFETLLEDIATLPPSRLRRFGEPRRSLGGGGKGSRYESTDLVTASALLDLVSESWLRALAEQCAANRAAVLFALTYDGRIRFSPDEPEDAMIPPLVNRHQRGDKGFGPALGPDAADAAARCFSALGYDVRRARSDWELTPESRALQEQVIDGWARAAAEIEPGRADAIEDWRARRRAHVAAGRSRMIVGHEDLAAWMVRP